MTTKIGSIDNIDTNALLESARANSAGRSSQVIRAADKGVLTQVAIALTAGNGLSQHENPGEALLLVLQGKVQLSTADESWELGQWNRIAIPQTLHELVALTDSVVILTMARLPNELPLVAPKF